MADDDKESKTEAPSAKRLQDAMDKGQFPRAPEITLVLMLAAALGAFSLTINTATRDITGLATHIFSSLGSIRLDLDTTPTQIYESIIVVAKVALPILGACLLGVLLAGGIQSGFNLTPGVLGFKMENLDISQGLQRLWSKSTLVHAGVDLLKTIAIALILWTAARSLVQDPLFSAPVEASYLGVYLDRATMAFLGRLIFALGVIASISYWYEFLKSRSDMKMSRQELKDEHKQTEGDGLVKGAMRRMARRLMQKQMLAQVPTADVVVTNPTHYAVALRYERGKDQAPIVLAKGENQFARRIKALAAEHGVPMVENRPVARMLYALGRVDEPIPGELYQAVAEILAVVYRSHRYYFYQLKARRAAMGSKPKSKRQGPAVRSPKSGLSSQPSDLGTPDRTSNGTLSEAA
ncbi:type III secretion protein [Opitutaceae bacterium EW11]|nr:type III secretion protein [Opitutaceae bacterium EW11]